MKSINRRGLLKVLASLPFWGLAAREVVVQADKLTVLGSQAGNTYAAHRKEGYVREFTRGQPIDLDVWCVHGMVDVQVEGLPGGVPVMFNGIEGFGHE